MKIFVLEIIVLIQLKNFTFIFVELSVLKEKKPSSYFFTLNDCFARTAKKQSIFLSRYSQRCFYLFCVCKRCFFAE